LASPFLFGAWLWFRMRRKPNSFRAVTARLKSCPDTKQKRSLGCAHRFRPTYPDFLHEAPPTSACAAFFKESRMESANARKFDRKSGVRWCERGHPSFPSALPIFVDCLRRCYDPQRPEIWVRGGLGGGKGCCLLRKSERTLPTFDPMRSEANIRSPAVRPGRTWW
jgi:hypothetical protein